MLDVNTAVAERSPHFTVPREKTKSIPVRNSTTSYHAVHTDEVNAAERDRHIGMNSPMPPAQGGLEALDSDGLHLQRLIEGAFVSNTVTVNGVSAFGPCGR